MNILWLSHLLPFPPKGGAAQRSYHLIKKASQYYNVHLIAFNQRAMLSGHENIDSAKEEFQKFCTDVQVLDIPVDYKPFGQPILALKSLLTIDPYNINWLKSSQMHSCVSNAVSRNKYDLIWFDTISLVPYLRYAKGLKTILNHHNIESDMMIRRAIKEPNLLLKAYFFQEGKKLQLSEKRYCPSFSLNVTCSELDSIRLKEKLPGVNSAVIPNGVDIQYFESSGKSEKKHSLIFAGTLSWYPNSEAMLYFADKVWPLLTAAIPDVQMTVVGKDPPQALLKLSSVDNRFKVTGFVEDVRPYIEEASVYVCPIMNGGGTKLKILDALSMGKAIVAHPIACEGIEVQDGETVHFATSPELFVKKISTLFENDLLRKSTGMKGRQLAENLYSYDQIGKVMDHEIKNLSD